MTIPGTASQLPALMRVLSYSSADSLDRATTVRSLVLVIQSIVPSSQPVWNPISPRHNQIDTPNANYFLVGATKVYSGNGALNCQRGIPYRERY